MEHLRKELESVLGEGQVLQNEPLGRHTTFRVGGPADLFVTPDILQLPKVMEIVSAYKTPVTVIGNGSNLLVGDRGIRGVVIEIGRQMGDISVDGESVTAQAGALLSRVAGEAYKNGLSGLEFAAGIPGSTGGAMVMNAGAYGGEMKDVTVRVKALSGDGNILNLDAAQMDFSYRHSCVAERGYLVLEAVFLLQKADPERIVSRASVNSR